MPLKLKEIISKLGARNVLEHEWWQMTKFKNLEIRKTTVDDWAQVPEYKNALEKSLGADALPQMKDMVAKEIDTMMMQCNQMYKNFVKIINN